MRKGVLLLLVLLAFLSVRANNVQLQGAVKVVSTAGGVATLEVELSWDNSWRDDYNWDAVWLFFKYKEGTTGDWKHAAINTATATVTGDNTTMFATTGATAQGVFIYPDKIRGGNSGIQKVQVQWATGYTKMQFENNEVFVSAHGIEMVFIPHGTYALGDGSSPNSFCTRDSLPVTIYSEGATTLFASPSSPVAVGSVGVNFPKGYQGFYIMKYETSQEQYVEFINALTLAEQMALLPGVESLSMGDFVFGRHRTSPNNRNGVILSGKITGRPLLFDNNLNNNKVYSEDADGGTLAMNYMSIADACGYASWAGLRPLTEMEYEKACRRPYPQEPEAGEFAWNSASGAVNASGLTMSGSGWETVSTGNVNAGGTINGPLRCGIFSRRDGIQPTAGATYCGVMEMSGNVKELCATITNTTISKTVNGTGTYNASLFGSGPTGGPAGSYGTRGGGFSDIHTTLTTSSRGAISYFTDILQRDSTVGFRCAFTYNAVGAVDAGTITFRGDASAVCPGETITIASLTAADAGNVLITGYEWRINGVIVPGAVLASLTLERVVGGQTYSIVRKAVCPLGEASTAALTIQVIVPKLLAGATTSSGRCEPGVVTISNATLASIECGYPITYSWLINGEVLERQDADSLIHTFTATGNIPVIRRASANGTIADATTMVAVISPSPQAGYIASVLSRINVPATVTVANNGDGSVGCGGFTYSWFIDDIAIAGSGSSLTHTFTSLGTYTATRRTTADNGTYADASATVLIDNCGELVYDAVGHGYTTKLMADGRCWMTQNCRRDDVGTVKKDYQYPDNDASNASYYGCQYSWSTAMNKNVCPSGFHVPSDGEWGALVKAYGGDSSAGWYFKDSDVFNMTLSGINGKSSFGSGGRCWSSTPSTGGTSAYNRYVNISHSTVGKGMGGVAQRYSVRCVK